MSIICTAHCGNEACRRHYDITSLEEQLENGTAELVDLSATCTDYIEGIVIEFDRGFKHMSYNERLRRLGKMIGDRLAIKTITHEIYRQILHILTAVGVSVDDIEIDIEKRKAKWCIYDADRKYTYTCDAYGRIKKK